MVQLICKTVFLTFLLLISLFFYLELFCHNTSTIVLCKSVKSFCTVGVRGIKTAFPPNGAVP